MQRGFPGRGRGGFSRGGGNQGHAELRANVVSHQSNSLRRLQKDLKEVRDSDTPLVGVSATPVNDSMYTWHANIRGPAKTAYQGGVFHMQLDFPEDYPLSPPSVTLFSEVPHPNVFGRTLCLDMLQKNTKGNNWYEGWSPCYTVQSILIQLQTFLFEVPKKAERHLDDRSESDAGGNGPNHRDIYRLAVEEANSYKCTICKHRGPIEPFPAFHVNEKDEDAFVVLRDEHKLLEDELLCYNTRVAVKDATLGVGVSQSRVPRTGEIRNVDPSLDLLCMRAFTKLKIRTNLSGERFTHWLPLYFGESQKFIKKTEFYNEELEKFDTKEETIDPKERCINHLKKSLAFLTTGSTRRPFTAKMVIDVMPKLIITHLVSMVDESKHISLQAIRRLVNFLRLFRLLIELEPSVEETIKERLDVFIKDESKRIKDHCGSLGDLLAFALVSKHVKLTDLLQSYLEEQLDRQAFWIIQKIPELDHTDDKFKGKEVVMHEARNEVCFKTGQVGFYMTMVFFSLCQELEKCYEKNMDKLCLDLDSNFGCLDTQMEDRLQKKFKAIQRIDNFNKYYTWLGLDCPDAAAIALRLRKAIDNSKAKRYHGCSEHMNVLPKMPEQAHKYLFREPSPLVKYNSASKKFENASDDFWKSQVHTRFEWVLHFNKRKQHTAAEVALESDEKNMQNFDKTSYDPLVNRIDSLMSPDARDDQIKATTVKSDYPTVFSYKHLYHKLCFEELIENFSKLLDFKMFYQYIEAMATEIPVLRICVLDKTHLKSNHYYLMAIVGRMSGLKTLKVHQRDTIFGEDGYKFLQKGLNFMNKNGQCLEKIEFENFFQCASQEYLYPSLKLHPDIQVLKFRNCRLTAYDVAAIGKVLADFKQVRELDLTNCFLDNSKVKEIADGLMRAKQLEILKVGKNSGMGVGVNAIIYNLAFSPKIRHIDISDSQGTNSDTAEALFKLLKISGAIETLLLGNSDVIDRLQLQFYQALGENKTIKYLDLTTAKKTIDGENLGKAVAMNAKRGGVLEVLQINGWFKDYKSFAFFLNAMIISDFQHEEWYGDKKTAKEMQQEQLVKKFHCALKYLGIKQSNQTVWIFDLKTIQKQMNPVWPSFMHLASKTQLDINLSKCSLTQKSMDLVASSIGENQVDACKIRNLDLSGNPIGKEGGKTLALALAINKSIISLDLAQCNLGASGVQAICIAIKDNNTLKNLSLYRNILDVNGARALAECLKQNKTIEFLDIGHNRIRQTGLKAICEGILANKSTKLTGLGIRANFINDDGLIYLFEKLVLAQGGTKLKEIYLRGNFLSEYQKIDLARQVKDVNVFVDDFQHVEYLEKTKVDSTIWVSPVPENFMSKASSIGQFFSERHECGLIADIRIRAGKAVKGRRNKNSYCMIQFADENSVPRALKLASKKIARLGTDSVRVFKAGTRTFVNLPSQRRK